MIEYLVINDFKKKTFLKFTIFEMVFEFYLLKLIFVLY